jgi:putative NADH-flavin reductase
MKIAVFGAAGAVGRRVVAEALSRGHTVTAVVRKPAQLEELPSSVTPRIGDAANADNVADIATDQDAVISAIRPTPGTNGNARSSTRALLNGVSRGGSRLLIVGGAASLEVPGTNGSFVIDDARFLSPSARAIARASFVQYESCLLEKNVDWVYLSPSARLAPGKRTGRFRLGGDELLLDEHGRSSISHEDLAVALIDEAEAPQHHQTRFTVGY